MKFEEAVFVLYCFQKKSKSGITTPKEDMDTIRARLKAAEALAKGYDIRKQKRIVDGIDVETGSGNIFADLGLPNAEKLKIESGLVIEITRAVRKLGLTQEEAGRRMGIPQPKEALNK